MKIAKSTFWISIYAGIGGFVLNLSGFLWSDGCSKIGLNSDIQFPFLESILFGLYEAAILVPTMLIIIAYLFARQSKLNIIAITTTLLTLTAYYLTTLLTLASKYPIETAAFGSYWAVIFGFLNGGIIGFSLYLHFILQQRSQKRFNDKELGIEALKLEQKWSLTAFTALSYATIIFVLTAVWGSWTQMFFPQIPLEAFQSIGIYELFAFNVVQLVYVGVGLWVGIIGRLLGYSLGIHNKMLELDNEFYNEN